jgi:hypothetical protein
MTGLEVVEAAFGPKIENTGDEDNAGVIVEVLLGELHG